VRIARKLFLFFGILPLLTLCKSIKSESDSDANLRYLKFPWEFKEISICWQPDKLIKDSRKKSIEKAVLFTYNNYTNLTQCR